jgi:pepF/M3 family oligoendopeptidase
MSGKKTQLTWDLDSIFPGGSNSPDLEEFLTSIEEDLDAFEKLLSKLSTEPSPDRMDEWAGALGRIRDLSERLEHSDSFAACLSAQDVSDERAMELMDRVSELNSRLEGMTTIVEGFAVACDDDTWSRLLDRDPLSNARFFWNELRRNAKLKMSPELERLAAELSSSGYHGWMRLYYKVEGELKTEFEEDGKTTVLSMGQLSNKFSSPSRDVRRQAFGKLTESWRSVEGIAAMALNSQAGYRLALYKARGWESPLEEPLLIGRLKRETLDAMWNAVEKGARRMSEFIDAKKRLLGIDRFRWYDQIAPVGASEKKYGFDEATEFVVEHLSSFSSDLGKFCRMAVSKRWVEAEDRPGKGPGAFCADLPVKRESRVFMTFSGNYDELTTFAHELGHAYHSWVLRDRDYFARVYPMNLAETASTFNELLVTDAALGKAEDPQERLFLLNHKLQEGFTLFCNIRARFLFDSWFYEERKKGVVPRERLNELMVKAQRKAFGDILSEDGYHPLFWASKLHFFDTEMPFYNFPYTYGYLFAGGIYDRAKKEGSAFAPGYKALLADTGSMTSEELAMKHLEVDLTKEDFWTDAVNRVLSDIETFVDLASSAG